MEDGISVKKTIRMSNIAIGVTYLCKRNELERFTEISNNLIKDMDILYDELCLRLKDFDRVKEFLKECEEFVS